MANSAVAAASQGMRGQEKWGLGRRQSGGRRGGAWQGEKRRGELCGAADMQEEKEKGKNTASSDRRIQERSVSPVNPFSTFFLFSFPFS